MRVKVRRRTRSHQFWFDDTAEDEAAFDDGDLLDYMVGTEAGRWSRGARRWCA